MELDDKEVSLLVDGLRWAIEKWQGMVDEAEGLDEDVRVHSLVGMLRAQIERAEAMKARLLDADVVEITAVRSMP